MQGTSRESLEQLHAEFDTAASDSPSLSTLSSELFSVVRLLDTERSLRQHLSDPAVPGEARVGLLTAALGGQLGEATMELLGTAVAARWSRSADLVTAVEDIARGAVLAVAEQDGSLDSVEDELFRLGRILDADARLNALLSDASAPAEGRLGLLHAILADKASAATVALLDQAVRAPRGASLHTLLEELASLVAARRERSVAYVTAPSTLTEDQEQRLRDVLTRIYGRSVSLHVEIDEQLLGGLVIRVGDDVIDGSVAGQLDRARTGLPG